MADLNNVPISISAKTRDQLTITMYKNNALFGCKFFYFDIQFVKGEWVAWYFNDILSESLKRGKA